MGTRSSPFFSPQGTTQPYKEITRPMRCPYCAKEDSRVIDTRESDETIRRRRECLNCGRRFTTYERVAQTSLMVIKQDGRREAFDREKLMRGITLACAKRPVETDIIGAMVDEVEMKLH